MPRLRTIGVVLSGLALLVLMLVSCYKSADLAEVVRARDWPGVWLHIRLGDDPNVRGPSGKRRPRAAHAGHGATTHGNLERALTEAALGGHRDVVALFLKYGYDPRPRGGDTSHMGDAAAGGRIEALKLLLGAGCRVDERDVCQGTALHAAAFAGNPAVIR